MTRRFTIDLGPGGDQPDGDNIEFVITGTTLAGEAWSEVFTTLPAMPAGLLVDIAEAEMMPIPKFASFMAGLLLPPDAERFDALIRDKDRLIRDVDLAVIVDRVLGAMTGRPSSPSVVSPGGVSNTGITSTGGLPSPGNGHQISTPDDSSTWLLPLSSTEPATPTSGLSGPSSNPTV